MRLFFFTVLFCFEIIIAIPTMAQEAFMPQTQDIPLMNGLSVDVNDDMNFDTPAGQLITLEAKSTSLKAQQILNYYHKTLPEMGWQETRKNYYTRDKDSVTISVIRSKKPAVVRFEIVLSNPA